MQKSILFPAFLLVFGLFTAASAQKSLRPLAASVLAAKTSGAAFDRFDLFRPAPSVDEAALAFAEGAQFLTLDLETTRQIAVEKPEALELRMPFHGTFIDIVMVKSLPLTDDFLLETSTPNASVNAFEAGAHYQGIVKGQPNSVAAFSFFDGEMMGLLAEPSRGNMVIGRLEKPGNRAGYIFYEDRKLTRKNPFACGADVNEKAVPSQIALPGAEVSGCVRIFFEADFELFQNKGSVAATVNYLTGAFNQMAALYANETISIKLSQLFVWTTPDFYDTASSSTVLNQFRTFRTSFNADLAHHVGMGGNNYGGIAYVDVLCNSLYRYAVSDIDPSYAAVPTFSWTVYVLTHETGHNLGSNHTQWCGWTGGALDNCYTTETGCAPGPAPTNGGTIMSYCHLNVGVNFSNGFGTQPGNLIRQRVPAATCLAASCTSNTCEAPSDLAVSGISSGTATISWAATTGATAYTLRWRAVGATTWTTISGAVSPQAITGLPSNDEIEATVAATCTGGQSEFQNGILFQSAANTATCNSPTNLTAAATSTTATTTWAAVTGAVSYQISWKLASATTWGAAVTTTSTSHSILGLTVNSAYNVRVQTTCSSGTSAFSTANFSTPPAPTTCDAPTNLTATATSSTAATANWSAVSGATAYKVSWKLASATTWGASVNVTGTSANLSSLTANSAYNVRVQTVCSGGATSAFTTANFSTPAAATCAVPTGLVVIATSATVANAAWTAVAGAVTYDLQYKRTNNNNWTTINAIAVPNRQVTGLQAGRSYHFRVRTVCAGGTSNYTANVTVTMPSNLLGGGENGGSDGDNTVADSETFEADERSEAAFKNLFGAAEMTVAPNPTDGSATIFLPFLNEKAVEIALFDAFGKQLLTAKAEAETGRAELDLSGLPSGLFFVKTTEKGQIRTARLVKN